MMNVLVICLVATNLRHVMASYKKYSVLIFETLLDKETVNLLVHPEKQVTIYGLMFLGVFPLISYGIEKLIGPSKRFPRTILFGLIGVNIITHIVYPIVFIKKFDAHPVMAVYMMMINSCSVLKLISFHHVLHDVRRQVRLI